MVIFVSICYLLSLFLFFYLITLSLNLPWDVEVEFYIDKRDEQMRQELIKKEGS